MYILELENIERHFGKTKALDRLCIHVPKGRIYGFLGRNGAGKTTTIKIILGLIKYHGGNIKINEEEISGVNTIALGRVGSIVEFPGFYPNLNAHDNLKVFQWLYGCYDKDKINKILGIVGLSDEQTKRVGQYSLGMKQRLGVARALLNDPDILILDEPINGLDPSGIREMRTLLKSLSQEHGKTIFLSSHILSEIEQIVDMIGIIKNGKTVEEISINALKEKCKQSLRIKTSDPVSAVQMLKNIKKIQSVYYADEGTIVIEQNADAGEINKFLVENSFTVSMLESYSLSLEDYFLNITA